MESVGLQHLKLVLRKVEDAGQIVDEHRIVDHVDVGL